MTFETLTGTVLSIQVGMPTAHVTERAYDGQSVQWTSGILKQQVSGPVSLGKVNLDGDGQGDLEHHGGPDRAMLLYSAEHYPVWREELGQEIRYGAFGENLTVEGLSEDTVCIGDIFTVGSCEVQVSQPRRPCWKLARRNNIADLPDRVLQHGWSGWYVRVLREGTIEPGQNLRLVDRTHPVWTITRAHEVYAGYRTNPDAAHSLASCPYLSRDWQNFLAKA